MKILIVFVLGFSMVTSVFAESPSVECYERALHDPSVFPLLKTEAEMDNGKPLEDALIALCRPKPAKALISGDSFLNKCREDRAIPEGKWKTVSYFSTHLCNKKRWLGTEHNQGNSVAYKIRKLNKRIEVSMSVDFKYRGKSENRAAVLVRLKSVQDCVQGFYWRFGIKLGLDFKVNSSTGDRRQSDAVVDLWDSYDRPNSNNWAMQESGNTQITADQACSITAHELGHLLGLPDRYADPDCPDRKIGPLEDVMRSGGYSQSADVKLFPMDTAIILKPLCGP